MTKENAKVTLAGIAAGAINGLLGAGGGMILVPALSLSGRLEEKEIFPASISIILPACIVSLIAAGPSALPWQDAAPYLAGSAIGGIAAGLISKRVSVKLLHRILGAFILFAGARYLWG